MYEVIGNGLDGIADTIWPVWCGARRRVGDCGGATGVAVASRRAEFGTRRDVPLRVWEAACVGHYVWDGCPWVAPGLGNTGMRSIAIHGASEKRWP